MRRDAKILLAKATSSLTISIELFNRPHDIGRVHCVVMLLDHSFEMLIKAALIQKGCHITDKKTGLLLSLNKCLRIALGDGRLKFLQKEQVLAIQAINRIRDAQQHSYIDISEDQLFFYVELGFTTFREILKSAFNQDLYSYLPQRVLPISTTPFLSLHALYQNEIEEIKKLIKAGSRKKSLALSKLKALEVLERAIKGEDSPLTEQELKRKIKIFGPDQNIETLFPNVSSIEVIPDDSSPSISLRFSNKEGIPIHIVDEGSASPYVVGMRKVNDLAFFNLTFTQLSKKVNLTEPKTSALVWFLKLKENAETAKIIPLGKSSVYKYSQKAIEAINHALEEKTIYQIWDEYKIRNTN